jgi:phosphonate transport system substrate-binding protein
MPAVIAQECSTVDELRFSIIPSLKQESELLIYKPLAKEIKKQTGLKVTLVKSSTYEALVSNMLTGKIHIARMGPNSFIAAKNLDNDDRIKAFATHIKRGYYYRNDSKVYHSFLIVNASSDFKNLKSLKNSRLLLTDPGSTSGALVPRMLFSKAVKQDLDSYFGSINYTSAHDISIKAIANRQADAAFVSENQMDNLYQRGKLNPDNFRILWRSQGIPQDVFVYDANLCKAHIEGIKRAFYNLHKHKAGKSMLEALGSIKFISATKEDYEIIEKIIQLKK